MFCTPPKATKQRILPLPSKKLILYLRELSKLLIKFDEIYLLFWKRAKDQAVYAQKPKIMDWSKQETSYSCRVVKTVDKIWWNISFYFQNVQQMSHIICKISDGTKQEILCLWELLKTLIKFDDLSIQNVQQISL